MIWRHPALSTFLSDMQGINTVEFVTTKLQAITFPRLSKPAVRPDEPPTEDLIRWGVKMYCYALIAQLRKVLIALVQIAKTDNVPATTILARHIFELTAHACYMSRKLKSCFERNDWKQAWEVLGISARANTWAKRYGKKYGPMPSLPDGWTLEIPDVLRIGNAISEYEQYQSEEYELQEAKENYSLLSELSHPNAACFQQHYVYHQNGRDVDITDAVPPISPIPHVNWCLIDVLRFLLSLFAVSGESNVRSHTESILVQLAARAPASRN